MVFLYLNYFLKFWMVLARSFSLLLLEIFNPFMFHILLKAQKILFILVASKHQLLKTFLPNYVIASFFPSFTTFPFPFCFLFRFTLTSHGEFEISAAFLIALPLCCYVFSPCLVIYSTVGERGVTFLVPDAWITEVEKFATPSRDAEVVELVCTGTELSLPACPCCKEDYATAPQRVQLI